MQIYQWVYQWKNFENRLTFGEVMGKSLVSCFFLRHSVYKLAEWICNWQLYSLYRMWTLLPSLTHHNVVWRLRSLKVFLIFSHFMFKPVLCVFLTLCYVCGKPANPWNSLPSDSDFSFVVAFMCSVTTVRFTTYLKKAIDCIFIFIYFYLFIYLI